MSSLGNTAASSRKTEGRHYKGLADFYSENPVLLDFLSFPQWRQFKFVLRRGNFFKVPDQVRGKKKLQEWIHKKKPLDVYYSVACWMRPDLVGARTEKISENHFLFADLAFDIDSKKKGAAGIEEARKQAVALAEFLEKEKIKVKYIAFSGSKGFHLVCEDPFTYEAKNPLEREEEAKKKRRALVEKIKGAGIEIDSKVTVDSRRIIRLPGTINSKSGRECRIISMEELMGPAKETIKKSKTVSLSALRIRRGDDRPFHAFVKFLGLDLFRAGSNPPYYFASFLSNRVLGTKQFIPIIEFPFFGRKKAEFELEKIQKKYGLNDAFLFHGEKFFAILPFALQKRRVEKILKAAGSANLAAFKKFGRTFTQISPKISPDMKKAGNAPEFAGHFSLGIPRKTASNSHLQFLLDAGIELPDFPRKAGKSEYLLSHAIIEN
jgi:hypothetical protein